MGWFQPISSQLWTKNTWPQNKSGQFNFEVHDRLSNSPLLSSPGQFNFEPQLRQGPLFTSLFPYPFPTFVHYQAFTRIGVLLYNNLMHRVYTTYLSHHVDPTIM